MRKNLSPDDLRPLLEGRHLAILATTRRDGSVLLSPVWHEWNDGGFSIVIEAGDVKSRHIRRDPRVTVIVAEQVPPYRSLEIRGEAALEALPDADPILRRIAVRYLGDAAGNAYADAAGDFDAELLRLAPGVVRAWDYRDDLQ